MSVWSYYLLFKIINPLLSPPSVGTAGAARQQWQWRWRDSDIFKNKGIKPRQIKDFSYVPHHHEIAQTFYYHFKLSRTFLAPAVLEITQSMFRQTVSPKPSSTTLTFKPTLDRIHYSCRHIFSPYNFSGSTSVCLVGSFEKCLYSSRHQRLRHCSQSRYKISFTRTGILSTAVRNQV